MCGETLHDEVGHPRIRSRARLAAEERDALPLAVSEGEEQRAMRGRTATQKQPATPRCFARGPLHTFKCFHFNISFHLFDGEEATMDWSAHLYQLQGQRAIACNAAKATRAECMLAGVGL